jgi:hypothetical protein
VSDTYTQKSETNAMSEGECLKTFQIIKTRQKQKSSHILTERFQRNITSGEIAKPKAKPRLVTIITLKNNKIKAGARVVSANFKQPSSP